MSEIWWIKLINKQEQINAELIQTGLSLDRMIALQKELSELEETLDLAHKANQISGDIEFLRQMLLEANTQKEKQDISDQLEELEVEYEKLDASYKELCKPTKNMATKVILEIRSATGGQEASLFAASLSEMYKKYAQHNGLEYEILSVDYNEIGGLNNISFALSGNNAQYFVEHESGVHRIQRIPKTESNGRIHTSTATVAVLLEPEEAVVDIDENYLRVDVFRASGAGGQHVNKTESAIRLTYEHPDYEKVVVSIQDERSQHKNKAKGMKILKAKIYEQVQSRLRKDVDTARKSQVGTGERSEKIRTYNFPQSRVTDHRSGLSVYNIQDESLLLPKDLLNIVESVHEAQRQAELG